MVSFLRVWGVFLSIEAAKGSTFLVGVKGLGDVKLLVVIGFSCY